MDTATTRVTIVDDDALVLRSLARVVESAGFAVDTYASPRDFLEQRDDSAPGCVLMDFSMPGLSGLEVQRVLSEARDARPIVFVSALADVPDSVAAMKGGAVDFVTKPVDRDRLLGAVRAAVERDRAAREARAARERLEERLGTLTAREREVLDGVMAGKLNKQIAADLGTAEKTIKVHRSRVMRKMGAGSLAELVRAWLTLRISRGTGARNEIGAG